MSHYKAGMCKEYKGYSRSIPFEIDISAVSRARSGAKPFTLYTGRNSPFIGDTLDTGGFARTLGKPP